MNILLEAFHSVLREFKKSFEAYGAVDSVKIITDKFTGSKGFSFVEMTNDDEAQKRLMN
jgi:RNA recognition motif-containing protein